MAESSSPTTKEAEISDPEMVSVPKQQLHDILAAHTALQEAHDENLKDLQIAVKGVLTILNFVGKNGIAKGNGINIAAVVKTVTKLMRSPEKFKEEIEPFEYILEKFGNVGSEHTGRIESSDIKAH